MGSLLGGWAGGGSHGVFAGRLGVHMGSLLGGWVAGRLGFLSHGVVGVVNPVLLLCSYDSDVLHYRIHLEAFFDREESEGATTGD